MFNKKPKFELEVFFLNQKKTLVFSNPCNLLRLLIKNKIPINYSCDGNATCGTCKVKVLSDLNKLKSPNVLETEIAKDREFEANERLACQITAHDGLKIKIDLL